MSVESKLYTDRYYADALDFVNMIRKAYFLEPITNLKPGVMRHSSSCVIAHSLLPLDSGVSSESVIVDSEMATHAFNCPSTVQIFIQNFDDHAYPRLEC